MTTEEAATVDLYDMTQATVEWVGEAGDDDAGTDADCVVMMLKVHEDGVAKDVALMLTLAEASGRASELAAAVARSLERREG